MGREGDRGRNLFQTQKLMAGSSQSTLHGPAHVLLCWAWSHEPSSTAPGPLLEAHSSSPLSGLAENTCTLLYTPHQQCMSHAARANINICHVSSSLPPPAAHTEIPPQPLVLAHPTPYQVGTPGSCHLGLVMPQKCGLLPRGVGDAHRLHRKVPKK